MQPLSEEKLRSARIKLSPIYQGGRTGGADLEDKVYTIPRDGVLRVRLPLVPLGTTELRLRTNYEDPEGDYAEASLIALPYYSEDGDFLQVTSSTREAQIGQYAVFHVRANFYMAQFHYVVSKRKI